MKFEIENINMSECFSDDGIIFLELFVEHIKILSETKCTEKINSFYAELSHSAYEYAKKSLLLEIKSEYEQSEDKRKRFSFRPYSYRFFCDVKSQGENYLSVICKLFFTRKGRILYEDCLGHIWNKRTGTLVPLRILAGSKYKDIKETLSCEMKSRGLSEKDIRGFALKNGELVFFLRSTQNGRQGISEIHVPYIENKEGC